MAPLPSNNTACVWVDYHDGINAHSVMARYNDNDATAEECLQSLQSVFEALDSVLFDITILGARSRAEGSDITVATTWPGASSYGADAMPAVFAPREYRFLGRSGTGRRVSFSFYGVDIVTPDNYRVFASDNSAILNAIVAINVAVGEGKMRPIDLSNQQMYGYASVNFNNYWEAQARG